MTPQTLIFSPVSLIKVYRVWRNSRLILYHLDKLGRDPEGAGTITWNAEILPRDNSSNYHLSETFDAKY